MSGNHTKNKIFFNRFLSFAVIVGFLCTQFHPFSHISHKEYSSIETHHTEYAVSDQKIDLSSPDVYTKVNCPDCILTKHLQVDLQQNIIEHLDTNSIRILSIGTEAVLDYYDYKFHLRAPPFSTV